MNLPTWIKSAILLHILLLICGTGFANEELFKQAKQLQRSSKYDEAIEAYKNYLYQPIEADDLSDHELFLYTESLVQLMNSYQSKGEADACITALQEVFDKSRLVQQECLRDFYSVMGYALSRTESMDKAQETMLKVFALPLYRATPERYFRDYAYAAAVFYSNTDYQEEVIIWCQEALKQAQLCNNTSGAQWVKAMLSSLYKRNGNLNEALALSLESKRDAEQKSDDLGVLNSLHTLIDLFLYYDIPEYANIYASEAVRVEKSMETKNPMISAQTYINKGRVLYRLGECDSVAYYTEKARNISQNLPYNSGMVDVNLLSGTLITDKGGDSLNIGIRELQQVTQQGTTISQAKAYHQLAQTYLRNEDREMAEAMLDSLYSLLNSSNAPINIQMDYEPILNHYLQINNHTKVEQFTRLMFQEQQTFKQKRLNLNLVESIIDLQTEQNRLTLKIAQQRQAHQRIWLIVCITISLIIISIIVILLIKQKRYHTVQMRKADERFTILSRELNLSNIEKQKATQEIAELLKDNDNRQEMETLTPFILRESGETKFRQYFELLYPHFLHRLRDKVPSITRREELLSMLIVLKQDNKEIAELLAIAPRSVLMLRHRFRQKIGMATEHSLENFIEETVGHHNIASEADNTDSDSRQDV